MFKLEIYQMPKSGRWRWKLLYNKRCLARADYHYATSAAAKKAFENMFANAVNQFTKDKCVPCDIV